MFSSRSRNLKKRGGGPNEKSINLDQSRESNTDILAIVIGVEAI